MLDKNEMYENLKEWRIIGEDVEPTMQPGTCFCRWTVICVELV